MCSVCSIARNEKGKKVSNSFEYVSNKNKFLSLNNIKKSIELKPNYELARYTLGDIYVLMGEKEKARHEFEYILEYISPKNSKARKQLESL